MLCALLLQGENVVLLAYGASSTGKSYTLQARNDDHTTTTPLLMRIHKAAGTSLWEKRRRSSCWQCTSSRTGLCQQLLYVHDPAHHFYRVL